MRFAGVSSACVVAMAGLVASGQPGVAQSRSAVVRVTAQVVDVGALNAVAPDVEAETAAAAEASVGRADAAGQMFSVVPPHRAAVAVSMHVQSGDPGPPGAMAIQLCPTAGSARAGCRQVPLADSLDGRQGGALTTETVFVRLLGLAPAAEDTTLVTVTLAYPGT